MTKGIAKEVIARYSFGGHKFEILVDPKKARIYKDGGDISVGDILIGDYIFTDISKAERVKEELLVSVFKTSNILEIAEKIIKQGEIQLTTEQRKEALEQKRNRIVAFISKHAVDPGTKLPHPPARIENALIEAKVRIDPLIKAEDQVKDVMSQLRSILPLSVENQVVVLKVPVKYGGTVRAVVVKTGKILKEEWMGQHWFVETEVPAGMVSELFGEVNSITHGDNESKIRDTSK